jgi:hypothetical protein
MPLFACVGARGRLPSYWAVDRRPSGWAWGGRWFCRRGRHCAGKLGSFAFFRWFFWGHFCQIDLGVGWAFSKQEEGNSWRVGCSAPPSLWYYIN